MPLSQLYGSLGPCPTRDDGRDITPASVSWSENDLAQLIGPRAWYVPRRRGACAVARERVEARACGGRHRPSTQPSFRSRRRRDPRVAVHVARSWSRTRSGALRVDTHARVLRTRRSSRSKACTRAGVDAGGVARRWVCERPGAGARPRASLRSTSPTGSDPAVRPAATNANEIRAGRACRPARATVPPWSRAGVSPSLLDFGADLTAGRRRSSKLVARGLRDERGGSSWAPGA